MFALSQQWRIFPLASHPLQHELLFVFFILAILKGVRRNLSSLWFEFSWWPKMLAISLGVILLLSFCFFFFCCCCSCCCLFSRDIIFTRGLSATLSLFVGYPSNVRYRFHLIKCDLSKVTHWLVTPTRLVPALSQPIVQARQTVDQWFHGCVDVWISLLIACRESIYAIDIWM